MKIGDLVRVYKHGAIGIITEVFADLGPADPWIRVAFTHPAPQHQWVKATGLELIKEGSPSGSLPGAVTSGSL
jgi:FAD/FMN-containing dehydrogenase|tara:strand:+ start:417 stop:635 length:219 start_codon:yes stop_codon:yes gene_type:complete